MAGGRCWPPPPASRARSPGCSSRSPGRRSGSPASPRRGLALALGGAGADRGPQPRLPDRRLRAVRVLAPSIAIPLLAAVVLWLVPPSTRALRIGAVLYALLALAAVRDRQPAGRQRDPARRAVRRARCWRSCSGRAGAGLVLAVSMPLALLAAGRAGPRRAQGGRRPLDRARLLRAAAGRARPARRRRRGAPGPDPADQEPLGGRLRRPRAPARARLAAPARVRGLRPVHRRRADRRGLPRVARRPRGRLRRGRRRPARLPRRGRGRADRLRARLPRSEVWTLRRLAPLPGRRPGADRRRGLRRPTRFEVEAEAAGELAPALNCNRYWRRRGAAACATRTAAPWSRRRRPGDSSSASRLSGARC